MRKNTKHTLAVATAIAVALTMGAACGKKKKEISAKGKQLMGKSWKYDTEASRTANLTKAGSATGIKNMKDIKLKGDVKKMADYLSAKSLFFGEDKKGGGLAFQITTGKGLLKSKKTGYAELSADDSQVTMKGWGKEKGKDTVYKIDELSASKLQWTNVATKTVEIYTR